MIKTGVFQLVRFGARSRVEVDKFQRLQFFLFESSDYLNVGCGNNLILKTLRIQNYGMTNKKRILLKKTCKSIKLLFIFARPNAEVAQLVELQPSKLVVASSSLVFRS